jgi:hypothetical protein
MLPLPGGGPCIAQVCQSGTFKKTTDPKTCVQCP